MKRLLAAALFAGLSLSALPALSATVSFDAADLATFTAGDAGVRFRALNTGSELFVGVNDLGGAANRTEASFTYNASQSFSLAYTAATGTVTATVAGVTRSFQAATGSAFNALRIDIRGPRTVGVPGVGSALNSFSLTGLLLNGSSVSNLLGSTAVPNTTLTALLSDASSLGGDLSLTGTLNYAGPLGINGSGETARVDVRFGSVPVAPVPLPAALPLLAVALGGLGLIARRRRAA